jgi:hypothetical protein
MQISLEALEQAFAPIEQIGQGELTFDVEGTPITIRILVSEEEIEVQKFATQAIPTTDEDEEQNNNTAVEYLERFKLGTISHAIIAIGDQDFRNADFIELPEKTPQGIPVKVKRYMAIRKLISKWSTPLRTAVFRKYAELLKNIEDKTEKAIKFEPTDTGAEIERLERKVSQLKKEQGSVEEESVFSKVTKGVSDLTVSSIEATTIEPEPAPIPTPQVAQARKPISPVQVSPATVQEPLNPVAQPTIQQTPSTPMKGLEGLPSMKPVEDDSFIDSSDIAAIDRENQRLFQMRQQQGATFPPPAPNGSTLDMVRNAKIKANADAEALAELERSLPKPIGSVEGVETYRKPVEELAIKAPMPQKPVMVNQQNAANGTGNPRFRKPAQGL